MSGALNYMNTTETLAIARFRDAVMSSLGGEVVQMYVFGSKVRGDFNAYSDIDILVVVKDRSLKIMDKIAEITAGLNIEYDLSIAPVVFSEQEYRTNESMSSPFSLAVREEGFPLS